MSNRIKAECAYPYALIHPNSNPEVSIGYSKYEDALLKITCAVLTTGDYVAPEKVMGIAKGITDAYFESLEDSESEKQF